MYDIQWELDMKLKPTINFILFDYIISEKNFTRLSDSIAYNIHIHLYYIHTIIFARPIAIAIEGLT